MISRMLVAGILLFASYASGQSALDKPSLPVLLSQFKAETDRASKERTLMQITSRFPEAGPDLLALAEGPQDGDTNWMAIRGIGYLKFARAVLFLERSLSSKSSFVRANAARALGEIGDSSAINPLITALSKEENSGVIEQTVLAIEMLHATKAIPIIKTKIENPSPQTRVWILGAISSLGGRAQLSFIAASLADPAISVRYESALIMQSLSGQDFGFPECAKRGNGPCGFDNAPVANAQHWWSEHKEGWDK